MNTSEKQDWHWPSPGEATAITVIDMHTSGEPLRVITGGLPSIEGNSVLEKRRYFRKHCDHLRTGLIFEPRGHADMYDAVISAEKNGRFDVFFLHNEGYSTMCGHAIIALTKLIIETGMAVGPNVSFNVPARRVDAIAQIEKGHVVRVTFLNVPSFVYRQDQKIGVAGLGTVLYDIAYGGAFYVIVDALSLGLDLDASNYLRLIEAGRAIKHAVAETISIEHPVEPDLSFLYGTIFSGPAHDKRHHSRNVCIFGEVDRSATGSGVSARAVLHYVKGELSLDETITVESILGSTMTVRVRECTKLGPHDAVIPEVGGTAFITGRSTLYFDPVDPFRDGFILR